MMTTSTRRKIIIGRSELMDLVQFGIENIPVKVDTGAFRSAIHATHIEERVKNGKKTLYFRLLGHKCHPDYVQYKTRDFRKVTVKNSFGHEQERYEIKLRVKIGPKVFVSPFTLADRSKKLFPVLLGRKVLKSRFVVDVSDTAINRLMLKKQFNIEEFDEEDLE